MNEKENAWINVLVNGVEARTEGRQYNNGVVYLMFPASHGSVISFNLDSELRQGAYLMFSIQSEDGTVIDNILVSPGENEITSIPLAEHLVLGREYTLSDAPGFSPGMMGTVTICIDLFIVRLFREPRGFLQDQLEYISSQFNQRVSIDTGLPGGPKLAPQLGLPKDVVEKWVHSPAKDPPKAFRSFVMTVMFSAYPSATLPYCIPGKECTPSENAPPHKAASLALAGFVAVVVILTLAKLTC
ncbi:hypothetical protein QCA50_018523 [Cerrena zonata]|uniref:Uncharacterized protein n=1 Tax=Cerrena zonata TaxID=2478898 RepID=A0AAW0FCH8_9APHY